MAKLKLLLGIKAASCGAVEFTSRGRPWMKKATQEILTKLKASLLLMYGTRLQGLYLYGSFAKGEERPGSDLDVAMILDDFERPWIEIQSTGQIVSDLSLEYEVTISLIPLRASDWAGKQKPLVRNIHREGVAV